MKKLVIIPLMILSIQAFAQEDISAKYAGLITVEGLKSQLTIIASDEMEGRETGTEGQRKAAAYIEEQFKKIGLKTAKGLNGYQQYYPLYQDSMVSSKLKFGNTVLSYGTDYIIQAYQNDNGSFKSEKLVFVGYGIEEDIYNDYATLDVKGKTVVMFLGEPKVEGKYVITGSNRGSEWSYPGYPKKLEEAAKKGAVGVLFINPIQTSFNPRVVENSISSSVYFPRESKNIALNYAVISHDAAKKLLGDSADNLFAAAKSNKILQPKTILIPDMACEYNYKENRTTIKASNVIGIIEGTDKKDEYVFLTAHYDHLGIHDGKIFNGADDDGSGTAGVIEMATAFAKAKAEGYGPRRTVVFMTVSGEEKGLWGSEYYSDHPIYPIEKTSVDLNTDMVGRIDTERKTGDTMNYVYVVGHDKLSSDLPSINEGANNKYTKLVLDYKFDDPSDPNRIYFRSDHYNFARKGIPVLFFYDGMLKADYHKPTDTVEKITWPLYETRVRMIFHTAWDIANRSEMLKRDIPLPETATRR